MRSPFVCALAVMAGMPISALAQRGGPATIEVETVVRREISATQEFVANVNANRRVTIGSAVDGRVESFMVKAGHAVKAGQTLAELRTRTIEIEIAGAEAELALRKAELAERKNGARPEEIELAKAQSDAARAADAYAKAKLKRFERLFQTSSGLSRDEYESARADALAATAAVDEAGSSLQLVEAGPRQEQIDQFAARVAVQEQIVEGLRDRLEKYTIRAPFDGFVITESTEAGAWLRQGDPVAEVVEIDPVEANVFVPETAIGFVQVGDEVDVTLAALGDRSFKGKIDSVVPLADGRARTFPVRVLIDNAAVDGKHPLLPGMLARVNLPTSGKSSRMLVPKDALQFGGASPVVFKVVDGKAQIVPVRPGVSDGDWIAVDPAAPDGLREGDSVVTRGNERLRPGQAVAVR